MLEGDLKMQFDIHRFLSRHKGKKFATGKIAEGMAKDRQQVSGALRRLFKYNLVQREEHVNEKNHWEYRWWVN